LAGKASGPVTNPVLMNNLSSEPSGRLHRNGLLEASACFAPSSNRMTPPFTNTNSRGPFGKIHCSEILLTGQNKSNKFKPQQIAGDNDNPQSPQQLP
jgi:hypothetical protein